MRLRSPAFAILVALVLAPLTSEAQPAGKVYRLGILNASSPLQNNLLPLMQALRELGYVENQNLVVESRFAEGRVDRLPGLAAELVQLKVDVILTASTPGVQAARRATSAIPIVFSGVADPVGYGLVSNLARPESNVTGISTQLEDLQAKEFQLLKEAAPQTVRVAILWNPENTGSAQGLMNAQKMAPSFGIKIIPIGMVSPATMARERPDAMNVHPTPPMLDVRSRIMEFAASHRVPTVSGFREMAEAGGFISYGSTLPNGVDLSPLT